MINTEVPIASGVVRTGVGARGVSTPWYRSENARTLYVGKQVLIILMIWANHFVLHNSCNFPMNVDHDSMCDFSKVGVWDHDSRDEEFGHERTQEDKWGIEKKKRYNTVWTWGKGSFR